MKQMSITIPRKGLYTEVAQTTAYLGAKQAPADDAGAHFDRMAVMDADNPLLGRFASEAIAALAEWLKGCVASVELTGEAIVLTLTLSGSYDDRLSLSVEGNVRGYMAAAVTARWLRLVQPEKEETWAGEARRLLDEISAAIYHRNPPRRNR